MNWRISILTAFIVLAFGAFAFYYYRLYVTPKKHAVILFIVPRIKPHQLAVNKEFQALNAADSVTFIQTRPDDDYASLMTRLASGQPGKPDQLGLSTVGQRLDTLLYKAQRKGRNVGIISTTRLTSPGVAAFFSHTEDALAESDIALQLFDSTQIDLVFGAGSDIFSKTKTETNRDLLQEAEKKGYRIIQTRQRLEDLAVWMPRKLLGLFTPGPLPFEAERSQKIPSLTDLTRRAIQKLQYHIGGYFLVIEHVLPSQVPQEFAEEKMLELDNAVATALAYAGRNTLLLVYFPSSEMGWIFLYHNRAAKSITSLADIHQLISKEL